MKSCPSKGSILIGYSGQPNRMVELSYILRYTPVMERRLAAAGARLAGILNAALK